MLTMFALPKPFQGHICVIQRNAIASWTRLPSKPEIILFGDEEGTAQAARDFGVHHVPDVPRNEFNTPLMSGVFERGYSTTTSPMICYINSDILLLGDFLGAVRQVKAWREVFLMTGRRLEVDLDEPEAYASAESETRLRELVLRQNQPTHIGAMDYFVFPRSLFPSFPPFTPGAGYWDNWLVGTTLAKGVPVVDASNVVFAVHQNHGKTVATWRALDASVEGRRNYALSGGQNCTRADATYRLTSNGMRSNFRRRMVHKMLDKTRGFRHALGIRRPASITSGPR